MSQRWTDLQRYVIEEHFEDYVEGRISRRELLTRVSYVTSGVAASVAALAALGCDVSQPRAGSGSSAATTAAAAPATGTSSPPNVAYAIPLSTASASAVTVEPDDPRLRRANPAAFRRLTGRRSSGTRRPRRRRRAMGSWLCMRTPDSLSTSRT